MLLNQESSYLKNNHLKTIQMYELKKHLTLQNKVFQIKSLKSFLYMLLLKILPI